MGMDIYQLVVTNDTGAVQVLTSTTNPEQHEAVVAAVVGAFDLYARTHDFTANKGLVFNTPMKRGPKGRPIHIVAVEENSNSDFTRFRAGDGFASSGELSTILGFHYDAAGIKLRQKDRMFAVNPETERIASLNSRRFSFRYNETLADGQKID